MQNQRDEEMMSMDEVSLRAAINVLRDSVESKCMPSGWALEGVGLELHEKAIDHLEKMLVKAQRSGAAR
jgi:hypothetical protein